MSSEVINLKAAGLQTYYQTLMEISPGALLKANNVVIDRGGVIEPRRGFKAYGEAFSGLEKVKQLMEYKGVILRHLSNKVAYDNGSGLFTDFSGSYLEPATGYRIKSAEAKGNFYFTTSEGVKKISAKTAGDFSTPNIIQDTGGPKAIAGSLALDGASGFLLNGNAVAYRILWIYTDRTDNLIFGAPSASMVINNTSGGTRDVEITFQIPYDVTSSDYKFRIYRSEMSAFGTPSDELYQVYEGSPTSGELAVGEIIVVDSLPEDLRIAGVPLYTNQYSGEGILKSNEPPPAAKDVALFKGHMFYANTRTRHSSIISLIDNTGLSGQTITIGANVYTFGATENISSKIIEVGVDIEATAKSLVRVVNGDSAEIVSAYYLSVVGEVQGKFILQKKTLANTSFSVVSSIGTNFNPSLTSSTASTAEIVPNRLYYSKYQEVEAVPLLNYIDIGSTDQEIVRIIPLRESLFVMKEDGVFRLAGDPGANPIWDVGAFDTTSFIQAADSAVTLGNQCYYYSNQGIMRLNESSLEPISRPIEDKLIPFISTNPNLSSACFALGYESDRALLMWTVSNKTDTYATVCYRYNTITDTWTEWKIAKTCAVLNRHQDKVYLGSAIDNYVEVERKNYDRFDYADRELASTLSASGLSGTVLKISNFASTTIEDVLLQEQYVTIYQFNSLLQKLDLDNGLIGHNFYQDLKMNNGDSLTFKMSALVAKLDLADPSVSYSALWTNPTAFNTIQTQFNLIITALNGSSGPLFSNYKLSTGTTSFEAIILSRDTFKSEITVNIEPAFMVGPLIIYKGIKTEVEYAPQHASDPAVFKQFSAGTFMFERRSFYTAQAAYKSDISDNYEEISFIPNSSAIFGGSTYGDGVIWGGQGDQGQINTYIPLKKQRCRFLGCKFTHGVALESFQLYGLSLTVRSYTISGRDYR